MSHYYKKKILVGGYWRKHPNNTYVEPYYRKQRFGKNPKYIPKKTRITTIQSRALDWSHQSEEYPNIVGLTDGQIKRFMDSLVTQSEKDEMKLYMQHMKCFTDEEIKDISKELYREFNSEMLKYNVNHPSLAKEGNNYRDEGVAFLTSPKGGFEVLSLFAYANHRDINKQNLPYDLATGSRNFPLAKEEGYKDVLNAESLPYGYKINDVSDIVFIDDVVMSGEQGERCYDELWQKLGDLDIDKSQYPRLHYMAIAGSKGSGLNKVKDKFLNNENKGGTVRVGFLKSTDYKDSFIPKEDKVSAFVFPFSIPDGGRHYRARELYKFHKKFPHRSL